MRRKRTTPKVIVPCAEGKVGSLDHVTSRMPVPRCVIDVPVPAGAVQVHHTLPIGISQGECFTRVLIKGGLLTSLSPRALVLTRASLP
jgi:hypothetical protein